MMNQKYGYTFLFLFYTLLGFSQIQVKATVDSTQMVIGALKIYLQVEFPTTTNLTETTLKVLEETEGLEVINSVAKWDTTRNGNNLLLRKSIDCMVFDSGAYFIPKIPFTFQQNGQSTTRQTNEILIEVTTLPANELADIKDIIKEPFKFSDIVPYLLALLSVALIGGLIYYFYQRAQRKEKPTIVIPEVIVPAHEIALKKLKALEVAELWQKGDIKGFQSELTFIIREYLENRYDIAALESTTHEILKDLKPINLSEDWKGKLREMLQLADLVKFAKAEPPLEAHARLLNDAENFVQSTKVIPVALIPENESNN